MKYLLTILMAMALAGCNEATYEHGNNGAKGDTGLQGATGTSGLIVKSGLDDNENGILDEDEVLTSSYLCDGDNRHGDDDDDGDGNKKVYVCHKNCKGKKKTLYLPPKAVQAHLNHGDTLGKCN